MARPPSAILSKTQVKEAVKGLNGELRAEKKVLRELETTAKKTESALKKQRKVVSKLEDRKASMGAPI